MPLGHLINLCQQYLACVYRMGSRKCHLFKRHLTAQPKSGTAINEHSWVPVGRKYEHIKPYERINRKACMSHDLEYFSIIVPRDGIDWRALPATSYLVP